MKWGIGSALAGLLLWPAIAAAQGPGPVASSAGVIRPAGYAWRNYVTVPDGPCGPPMSVQADCYVPCRPCGPLHPFCFVHRVGRMLSCLLPCNHCCHRGCGLHGCVLGGRWGGCGICCDAACGGCCGGGWAPAQGGHCPGCGGGASDPFQDDPVPVQPPAPRASEARYPGLRPMPTARPLPAAMPAQARRPAVPAGAGPSHAPAAYGAPVISPRNASGSSVLRRTSAESDEPIRLRPDLRIAEPVIRSQSPDESETATDAIPSAAASLRSTATELGEPVPYNPLRP
jgi:hypothetical protein